MREDSVQPLQRAMKMNLNPTRRTSDVLAMVLGTPPLHKAHSDSAHLCECVDSLKALIHTLGKELSKILIVENLQRATGRYFADGGGMKMMSEVAISTLDEESSITEALSKHFPSHIK